VHNLHNSSTGAPTVISGGAAVTLVCLLLAGCAGLGAKDDLSGIDFRAEMRTFVGEIADYGPSSDSGFVVIPQNGHELITADGEADGTPSADYVAAIDGVGREDLFYGYDRDDRATPAADTERISAYMDRAFALGLSVLVTDYCWTQAYVDDSYAKNSAAGYLSFAADSRELDTIPDGPSGGYGFHAGAVSTLQDAANFLYLIDPGKYDDKAAFVSALDATRFDVFIIDAFFDGDVSLTDADIAELQTKPGGARRLVIAYMSIGEAEDYRFYWGDDWKTGSPGWLEDENSNWGGNYVVRYWDPEWKQIIYGDADSYLARIIAAGFDGVYLDIIDAYEYFEDNYL